MNLHRFKTYETVYLFTTDYQDYSSTASKDDKYGTLKTVLWDDRVSEFLIQSTGEMKDSSFRFHPTYGDPLNEDEFLKAVKDFLYIFNKNQLKYKAKLVSSKFDQHLSPYAIFNVVPNVDISQIEKILATTKITNAKVKKDIPLDKLIYQTSKVEGRDYEWKNLQILIQKFLDTWAKNDNTDLHAVMAGKEFLPDWSDAQYKKGRKGEGQHEFYVIIEKLRQFQNRYN